MDIYIIGIKGQYVRTKKRFKNLGKIIGIVLFVALMFTNIKIALMDDAELASGDISVLGIELNLFEATYTQSEGGGGDSTNIEFTQTISCEACWNNGQTYYGTKIVCHLGGQSCQPDLWCTPTNGCGL